MTHELTVRGVVDETADTRSIEFDVPTALSATFAYKPGQFLSFDIAVDGVSLRRCYSLSSTPGIDPFPRVTVKRVADGRVSNWINDRVKAGDRLLVAPPAGRFVLADEAAPLCLYAGGSGITPIISILKFALATWTTPIRLFYANRSADTVIFQASLDRLAAEHPTRLRIHHHLDLRDGLTTQGEIDDFVKDTPGWRHYICGPAPFMALVESTLAARQVPAGDIHVERFTASEDDAVPQAPAAGAVEAEIIITLDGETRQIRGRAGETVLEAARRAGLQPPSSCESGICASCLAKITRGRATMTHNEVLNDDEIAEGLTLTCQAVPASDELHVEY
ncbi:MAG: ferredoxin--NADP reductase [Rhodospirillaceae bacterium]|nr:ferredoxin--NADP reductase [Rhodospirillaceae bacterium]